MRLLTPAPRTTPDEWARQNRSYPASAGIPGPREPALTGYLVPFVRAIHVRQRKRVVAVCAAQMGKTEAILDAVGARLDQHPAPVLYVGPSRDFLSDQFEPRLMAMLDNARGLRGKVVRGRRMKKTRKLVAGVQVRLASAASSSQLKSDSFALAIVDELDEMVANIKGQGDPLVLVEARGETYADFVTAIVSTPSAGVVDTEVDEVSGLEFWRPSDDVESPIWRLWQQGTRHHFAWPCPHCTAFFVPRFKHLKWPNGAGASEAKRAAYLECPSCGGVIEEHHKAEMVAGGVQIAPGQTVEEAREGVNLPDNATLSFWTSGLASPFKTFGERAQAYLLALESGEPDKLQATMNANFGELYSPLAGAGLTDAAYVASRALPYQAGEVPLGGLRLLMGVDVQKFSLYYVIRAYGSRGTSWLVEAGQLHGPTDQDEVWADLADRMLTPIGGMQIERVGIDSGFRPDKPDGVNEHKVYEFCRRFAWLAVPCKGKDVAYPPFRLATIEVKPDGKRLLYSIKLAWLSTDFFKSWVVSQMQTPMGAPGAWYVHAGVAPDYCRHMTSEVRTIDGGKPKWAARSRDNHWWDAESIVAAMAYSLNVSRIPEGVERAAPEGEAPDARVDAPPPVAVVSRATGGGLRSRFADMAARANRR